MNGCETAQENAVVNLLIYYHQKKRPKDGAFLFGRQAFPSASAWGALRWFIPFLPGWVRGRVQEGKPFSLYSANK